MAYLLIGYIGFKVYNKRKAAIICFGSALAGGIINVLSPGNYTRHESISNAYPVGWALKSALFSSWSRIQYLLFNTPFVVLIIMLFVVAYKFANYNEEIKYFNPFVILPVLFIGVTIINFPVCLGYSTGYFPNRCIWVEDCAIYLGMFIWIFYLVGWMKKKMKKIDMNANVLLCICISCILFICNLGVVRDFDSYPTIQMLKQLTNGEIAEYAEFWEDVLEEIESHEDKNVEIYRDKIKMNMFFYPLSIGSDENDWVNTAVAEYYGKDSIRIIVAE